MMKVMLSIMITKTTMMMMDCEPTVGREGHAAAHPPACETFKYSCKCHNGQRMEFQCTEICRGEM